MSEYSLYVHLYTRLSVLHERVRENAKKVAIWCNVLWIGWCGKRPRCLICADFGSPGLRRFNSHLAAVQLLAMLFTASLQNIWRFFLLKIAAGKRRHFWVYLAHMRVVRVQVKSTTAQSAQRSANPAVPMATSTRRWSAQSLPKYFRMRNCKYLRKILMLHEGKLVRL